MRPSDTICNLISNARVIYGSVLNEVVLHLWNFNEREKPCFCSTFKWQRETSEEQERDPFVETRLSAWKTLKEVFFCNLQQNNPLMLLSLNVVSARNPQL